MANEPALGHALRENLCSLLPSASSSFCNCSGSNLCHIVTLKAVPATAMSRAIAAGKIAHAHFTGSHAAELAQGGDPQGRISRNPGQLGAGACRAVLLSVVVLGASPDQWTAGFDLVPEDSHRTLPSDPG